MPSQVKNLSPVLLEMNVTVPAAEVERTLEQAIARLARETRLPGFRRGKVPRSVIQRMFGKALLSDLKGELVAKAYVEALAEHDISPVAEPEIDVDRFGELERGKDFEFTIEVSTAPRLEQVVFDGIEIRRREAALPDDLVDKQLQDIRSKLAAVVDPDEPRPVRIGDLVHVELERWINDEWKKSDPPVDQLVLEEGEIREEFIEALTGCVPGDEREIPLPRPDGESGDLRFKAKVVAIQERRLPDLDDELARDASEFETLAELRADIEQQAQKAKEAEEKKRLKSDLFDALRQANLMELPEPLVRMQAQAMQRGFRNMLGLDAGGAGGEEKQGVHEALMAGAEKSAREVVHMHFLTLELARIHGIEVTSDDVDAEIERIAAHSGLPVPRVRAEFSKEGRIREIESRLLEDKVLDFALARVKVVDADASSPDSDDGKD